MTAVQRVKGLSNMRWLPVMAWMSLLSTCITPVLSIQSGHCELTQRGSVLININETVFNLSSVEGFCVCNQTGIHLDKILCFPKPNLQPTCGHLHKNASWCVEEMLSNIEVIAITGKYVMVEIAHLKDLHISHFTTMLEVNGEHNVVPLVCTLYLDHTLVEDSEKSVEKNSTSIVTTSSSASPTEPKSSRSSVSENKTLKGVLIFCCFIAVLAVY